MSLQADSIHYAAYYDHILCVKKVEGPLGKVYDIIADLSDRRGIKWEWGKIDADVQDEIIETWVKILEK
jgi:hypothetical protein